MTIATGNQLEGERQGGNPMDSSWAGHSRLGGLLSILVLDCSQVQVLDCSQVQVLDCSLLLCTGRWLM